MVAALHRHRPRRPSIDSLHPLTSPRRGKRPVTCVPELPTGNQILSHPKIPQFFSDERIEQEIVDKADPWSFGSCKLAQHDEGTYRQGPAEGFCRLQTSPTTAVFYVFPRTHSTVPTMSRPRVDMDKRQGGIAILSFANPPVNALSSTLQKEISTALKSVLADSSVRAVVVHGAGSPGFFSSGADVSQFAGFASGQEVFSAEGSWFYSGAEESPIPVVAAVDGVCFGGALEFALCCSARVASEKSSFSLPELKLGIIPGLGGTQRLPRLVGFEKAIPMMLNSSVLPAHAACDAGLHGGRKGLKEEARVFLKLVTSPESQGTVHMFFGSRQTSKVKLQNDPCANEKGRVPKKVSIIGGGLMGAGIATAILSANIPVVIKELNEKFAASARKRVERNLGIKGASKMQMLSVTTEYDDLRDVDIVIEAALENPSLKQEIFAALESTCRPDCILATNTSTINLDLIGMGAPIAHKEGRIIGVHFFAPAHRLPLLEVVRTESTSAKTIKDVLALGKKIKKTPVVVGNCAGFAVNRLYFPQSMVAGFLLIELGLDPYKVDRVCEAFGLPMGPFRLSDLVGLDISVAVGSVFSAAFADRTVETNPVIAEMLGAGRKGQKSGVGFYRYSSESRKAVPDPDGIAPFLERARAKVHSGPEAEKLRAVVADLSDSDIVNMIHLSCVNEGYRILEEGVAMSSVDLDVCSVMGMAFPAFRGGLMYWAEKTFGGAVGVLQELERFLKMSNGFPLFKPSQSLIRSAARNKAVGEIVRPPLSTGEHGDVVIVSAFRTAVGRAGRGGFKDTLPDNLMIPVLKRVLEDTDVNVEEVGDLVAGNVLQRGDTGVVQLRVAGLLSGLPTTVPVRTVNRLCSSGLQAIADGAAAIQAGYQKIVIAGGMESMSMASMQNKELRPNPQVRTLKEASSCYFQMGETSENVAEKFGVSREKQDKIAVSSHAKASVAKLAGRQKSEIVPVKTRVTVIDRETKKATARLAKLPAVFRKGGSTTPGNSSQLSDGAALVMLMKRSEAEARGLEPLARLRSYAVTGVDPAIMGIGPAAAIPLALEKAGITTDDVDLFEINEAFGSQAEYCIEKLGLNRDIVNVNGGAIAIGHPLGMTGARLTVSIIHELHRRQGRFGVVSMCIGSGMGAAAVYEINKPQLSSRL
ncbi:Fatty acid beta-oxydation multifunctional protein [Chondrus crispus]|uniref:Fatty acid beta-oxydation multifunctional protein n=1 Tax=Chondrus crispus TaxID=2769 RepID=R7QMB2_CHOCR|nr:Fatty acid beta-oxydation multifunctional protein [Chondrus crispus]CDF38616.1 Fatty acid beta-oxydation multifunctional protein [Chondrus crispus]|eukprot:XP_005718521.1 Fatty acid beta-oxydation multifunctional protein [Chondrus crispus]